MGRHLCRSGRYATDTHRSRSFTLDRPACCASEQFAEFPAKEHRREQEDRWTRSLPIRDAISTRGWSVEFLFRPGRETGYSALSTRYPTDLGFRENFATHGGEPGCWRIDPSSYPAGLNYFFKKISSRYFGENRSTIGRRRRTATTRPRLHGHFFSFPLQLFCRRG